MSESRQPESSAGSVFDLPPEEIRRIGGLAADAVAEHRARLLDRPVFGKVGDAAALFDEPLPEDGESVDEVQIQHVLLNLIDAGD